MKNTSLKSYVKKNCYKLFGEEFNLEKEYNLEPHNGQKVDLKGTDTVNYAVKYMKLERKLLI